MRRKINILCLAFLLLICFYTDNAAMAYSDTYMGPTGNYDSRITLVDFDNNGQLFTLTGVHRYKDNAMAVIKRHNGSSWYDYPQIITSDYNYNAYADGLAVPLNGRPVVSFSTAYMFTSYGYLYYYNGASWVQLLRTSGVAYKLALAPDGSVWVGGSDGALYRFNGSSLENRGNIGFGISSGV